MAQTPQQATQAVIDRLTTARDSERLRSDLVDALQDEPFDRFTEWAESLTEVAEAIDTARDAIESWRDSESREDKAAAKEDALAALDTLLTAWDASPLDLATLTDYDPEATA